MGCFPRATVQAALLLVVTSYLAVAPMTTHCQEPERQLRFLGNENIPPIMSLQAGKPVGVVVDLANALAAKTGLSMRVEAMDWSAAQSEVLAGAADALLQINPDAQRERVYDFSDVLLESSFQIFRKSTRTDIQSLASLAGKKIAVESGGFPSQYLGGSDQYQLVLAPSWKAAFVLLNSEQADAVVVDRWVGEYELAVNGFEGIAVVDPPLVKSYSRIAVKKGNQNLLHKINIGLEGIKKDGTYQQILDKWRPKEVIYFTRETIERLKILAVVVCGAVLLFLAIRATSHNQALKKINHELAIENRARRAAESELAASHQNLELLVEQRTAELRQTDERLKLFIDRAPAAIAMFDRTMRYIAASRRFVADYGLGAELEPAALVGRSHYDLFPEIPERWREIHRRVLAGETLSAEEDPFPREDGHVDWVRWEMAPWYAPDGAIGGALLLTDVVTRRKEAEANLLRTAALLRAIGQSSPDPIYAKDLDGRFIYANPAVLKILGKSADIVLGHADAEWHSDPEQAATVMANDRRILQAGIPEVIEETWDSADQGMRTYRSAKAPLYLDDGSLIGIVCLSSDITGIRTAEATLQQAKTEAEQANQAKSRFLAAASHDLRQPLQALNLYLGILAGRVSPADAPIMKHIDTCLVSLSGLLGDLLDLSKLDAGVVRPAIADFPLADIFRNLVSAHGPLAEAKGIGLRAVPTKLWAKCDPILFGRAVGNLVANAVRYTEQGGVVIGCRRRQGTIWVEVVDTGIGIAQDDHEVIFEEFRQLGNHKRNREMGTGLGLAIVKKTAALLGLEVKVTSRIGRGSIFALSVPFGVPARNDASPASEQDRSLRIALVEDDANVREALVFALTAIGHAVVAAPSAEALLARLDDTVPDFILADYRLGEGRTGLDVVAAVRTAFGKNIPAAVLTGETDPAVVRKIAACGATVLHKPLQLDALGAAIGEQMLATT
jgi:hypothetical protein